MYNPFTEIEDTDNNDKNNFYEQSLTSSIGDLTTASKVLEQCKEFNISELKKIEFGGSSSLFYNIGGNSTNFDKFVTEIKCIDHSFSFIGLAETNIDQMHSDQNEKEVIVGVVYRSPNCNFSEFLVTYKTITDQLPSKKFV